MLFFRRIPVYLFLVLLWPAKTRAHANDSLCTMQNCTCHQNLVPAGLMMTHVHERNEWMISYRYMHMQMKGLLNGSSNINQQDVFVNYLMAPESMRMDMHMLMGMYGLSDRLTLMGMTSFNTTSMRMNMYAQQMNHAGMNISMTMNMGSGPHEIRTSGLGDIKLYALYACVKSEHHQLVAAMGVNLPTGSVSMKGEANDMMYPNQFLPYGMQLGSGTVDFLPGLTYLYTAGPLGAGVQATANLRTFYNQRNYHYGNEATFNTWITYRFLGFLGISGRVEGNMAGSISGYDPSLYWGNEPAANPYNYGGQKVNTYGGVYFSGRSGFLSNQTLAFEYGVPVYQHLNGIQMQTKQLINAAWSLTF